MLFRTADETISGNAHRQQPGDNISIFPGFQLMKSLDPVILRPDMEKPGKRRLNHILDWAFRPINLNRTRQYIQGLCRRENGQSLKPVIPHIGLDPDVQWQPDPLIHDGKVFHRWTVFGSTATGSPAELRAQCLVKPRQINWWVSAWVIT